MSGVPLVAPAEVALIADVFGNTPEKLINPIDS
jgi:hypothetical protein